MCYESRATHSMHSKYCHCGRHFLTTEEKIEKLEEYKKWLEHEKKGVEEVIQKLKKAN